MGEEQLAEPFRPASGDFLQLLQDRRAARRFVFPLAIRQPKRETHLPSEPQELWLICQLQ